MAELFGTVIVHNTCVLNLSPHGFFMRVDSCSLEWVRHILALSVPECEYSDS